MLVNGKFMKNSLLKVKKHTSIIWQYALVGSPFDWTILIQETFPEESTALHISWDFRLHWYWTVGNGDDWMMERSTQWVTHLITVQLVMRFSLPWRFNNGAKAFSTVVIGSEDLNHCLLGNWDVFVIIWCLNGDLFVVDVCNSIQNNF